MLQERLEYEETQRKLAAERLQVSALQMLCGLGWSFVMLSREGVSRSPAVTYQPARGTRYSYTYLSIPIFPFLQLSVYKNVNNVYHSKRHII